MSEPPPTLPTPPAPPFSPPPERPPHNGRKYLIGIGIGFIPVALLWLYGAVSCPFLASCRYVSSGVIGPQWLTSAMSISAFTSYAFIFLAMIVLLSMPQNRFIGYGLLTMVLIAPIVGVVGCLVISGATHPYTAYLKQLLVAWFHLHLSIAFGEWPIQV